jgi:hypothetical protein
MFTRTPIVPDRPLSDNSSSGVSNLLPLPHLISVNCIRHLFELQRRASKTRRALREPFGNGGFK